MTAQQNVLKYLKQQQGKPRRSDEIAAACGIYDKTATKEIFYLREKGVSILDRFVDDKWHKVYWLEPEQLRQVDHKCICGSYYRRGRFCNQCARPDDQQI